MPERTDEEIKAVRENRTPGSVLYFAYGSNMATARLRARTLSCEPLGIATLPGHVLRFHKTSKDGSAKCNAFATGGDSKVIGVLFNFNSADRRTLDRIEGAGNGYEATTVTVIDDEGRCQEVLTYLATQTPLTPDGAPSPSTRTMSSPAARNTSLPDDYVAEHIDAVAAVEDPDRDQDKRERATLGNS